MDVTRNRFPRRRLLAGAVGAPFLARFADAAEPAGTVDALRGMATAQAGTGVRPLAPAASIFVGDLVATTAQSAIALRLGSATLVRLGAEARLRIDRFLINAGTVLELANGAMMFDHDSTVGRSDAAIRSPFGLIAVRGTRFFAGPSNGLFGVFVYRGEVLLVGRTTAVPVQPEFGSDIAAPGEEPTLPHRWTAARINAAEASVM
jgi:hypothetical protein